MAAGRLSLPPANRQPACPPATAAIKQQPVSALCKRPPAFIVSTDGAKEEDTNKCLSNIFFFYLVKKKKKQRSPWLLPPPPIPKTPPNLSCKALHLPLSQSDFQVNTSQLISLWRWRRATVDGVNVQTQRGGAEDGASDHRRHLWPSRVPPPVGPVGQLCQATIGRCCVATGSRGGAKSDHMAWVNSLKRGWSKRL